MVQQPVVLQPQVASLRMQAAPYDALGGSMVQAPQRQPAQGGASQYYAAITGNKVQMPATQRGQPAYATTQVPGSQVTISSTPQQMGQILPPGSQPQSYVPAMPQTMPAISSKAVAP